MSFDAEAMIGWMLSNVGYVEDDSGNTPWSERWGYPGGAWCGMYYQSGIEAGGGTVDDSTGTVPHTELTNTGAILFHDWGQWTTVPRRGDAEVRRIAAEAEIPRRAAGIRLVELDQRFAIGEDVSHGRPAQK